MALHGAEPTTHTPGGLGDRSTNGNVGGKSLYLGWSRRPRERPSQVSLPHACRRPFEAVAPALLLDSTIVFLAARRVSPIALLIVAWWPVASSGP